MVDARLMLGNAGGCVERILLFICDRSFNGLGAVAQTMLLQI